MSGIYPVMTVAPQASDPSRGPPHSPTVIPYLSVAQAPGLVTPPPLSRPQGGSSPLEMLTSVLPHLLLVDLSAFLISNKQLPRFKLSLLNYLEW